MTRAFLDSNVILYYYTSNEISKAQLAGEVRLRSDAIISTQVLSECCNVLSKKRQYSWIEIQRVISEIIDLFSIETVSVTTIGKAIELAQRYHYSYYDSLILASAIEANCSTLYSEDFQHNQLIEGVRIINPFL
ncbi:MAG TPA: PIN domain-containing protein [Candidatus Kapabacteria bacterium]|jgi:predicted nucleic acid-binding protein|nr:PIN domain-containing protein [Candidatus Kapabacteria bacterium]